MSKTNRPSPGQEARRQIIRVERRLARQRPLALRQRVQALSPRARLEYELTTDAKDLR